VIRRCFPEMMALVRWAPMQFRMNADEVTQTITRSGKMGDGTRAVSLHRQDRHASASHDDGSLHQDGIAPLPMVAIPKLQRAK
jgi:hypothetical protein